MRRARRVMLVFGTRPEAIKMAPVALALQSSAMKPIVAVTAQHREMLDQVLDTFAIAPDVDLDIISPDQSLTEVSVRVLQRLEPVFASLHPDLVVVQGDTTTTVMGALAAFYARIPVVHMEAGLRTGDPSAPYPEEINRRLTTQIAELHLAPTHVARANLLREGVPAARVVVTGNTVIDALHVAVARHLPFADPVLDAVERSGQRVVLVTAHRRESWGSGMLAIGRALAEIVRTEPDVVIVFPIHRNPRVRQAIVPQLAGLDRVVLTEPMAYGPFARLLARADLVLTDSGGIQEEAPSLGKPVLVMRDRTERPEAVMAGTVRLVGTRSRDIVVAVRRLLHDEVQWAAMARAVNPYGDGRAAERTVAAIGYHLGIAERPDDFDGRGPDAVDLRRHRDRVLGGVHLADPEAVPTAVFRAS